MSIPRRCDVDWAVLQRAAVNGDSGTAGNTCVARRFCSRINLPFLSNVKFGLVYNALMFGEIHRNYVLYRNSPLPGHTYRQIAVIEGEQFEMRIWEGDVIQEAPFQADNPDAECYFHPTLPSALTDAQSEIDQSKAAGWIPHRGFFVP